MGVTAFRTTTDLRTAFAARLSELYGREVPAYTTLVDVSREVNERAVARWGEDAQRLGSIERVTAERHGAIRVGSPEELAQAARVFAAFGMHPTGFYDLRDAAPTPIPVVSTAFRPVNRAELAANPFRVFTSMLVVDDRRFFDADLEQRLRTFIGSRTLFGDELLALADQAAEAGGLEGDAEDSPAERLLELAVAAFALSPEPVDKAWYAELAAVSDVAADIGGVASTHINHLTPRVLDIEDLYDSMTARGIEMIDRIQGPPGWEGPDVLLRQTSFRALAEPRMFRELDGTVVDGALRVRFGEVEARGIAVTPEGRELYARLMATVAERAAAQPDQDRAAIEREVWAELLPATEQELYTAGLAHFTVRLVPEQAELAQEGDSVADLVVRGVLALEPIVYEDFLPQSAAGIFSSNLTGTGSVDQSVGGDDKDAGWLARTIGHTVHDPEELYAAEARASLEDALGELQRLRGFAPRAG